MSIEHLLEPVFNRIRLMIGRCVVIATRYNSGDLESDIELVAGERRRDVEFVQQYGFSSRPKGNVSGVALFVGGSRDNGVVIATNGDDIGEKLEEGEVLVHSPHGQKILLKSDGNIEISCSLGSKVLCKNDLIVDGNIRSKKEVSAMYTADGVPCFNLSPHPHASAVGPTSAPTPTPPTP